MATDYTLSVSLKNKTTGVLTQVQNVTITGGDHEDSGIWDVTTTEISHTIDTDLVNVHSVLVWNLAAANYVEMGYATTVYDHKIGAGEGFVIPLVPGATTVYLKANTADQAVLYRFIEAS